MSIFNRKEKDALNPQTSADLDNGVPSMEAKDTATIAAQKAAQREAKHRLGDEANFRARENMSDSATVDDAGLPSVNRRRGGNKLVTTLGFIFILGAAAAMIVAVNSGDKSPKTRHSSASDRVSNTLPPIQIPEPISPQPMAQVQPTNVKPITVTPSAGAPRPTTAAKVPLHWSERKMMGEILTEDTKGAAQPTRVSMTDANGQPSSSGGFGASQPNDRTDNALGDSLRSTQTTKAKAGFLGDRNYIVAKGTALDCALETALDSSVPGLTTCRLTRDVYSDNGQVLLLDRGSQLVGEYKGGLKQGQVRLFVLWTRAKTPNGVVVNLNSPGTDALGRSGHDGFVNNHFWQRFGAAIMMSLISDSIKIVTNDGGGSNGSTNNYYGNTANDGGRIVEKVLESTVNIPPTIVKNQGDHIQVMVARDLDFSGVYALEVKE